MKSDRYSDGSIQAVLDRLDGATFLKETGLTNGDYVNGDGQIKSYCPICHDRSKMSLVIDTQTRRGHCSNLYCQGSNLNTDEGNLVELYALSKEIDLETAIDQLATKLNVTEIVESLNGGGKPEDGSFNYVEVGHFELVGEEGLDFEPATIDFGGTKVEGRGLILPLDQIDDFVAKCKKDVYWTHFKYNSSSKQQIDSLAEQGKLVLSGDFYVVFDASSSAEIVHAINQAIDLVERLKENYDVPYDAVFVFYTNRNIEVHIDAAVFGIQPTANLHEIYRRQVCALIGVDPLKPHKSTAFSQINLNAYRHDYLTNIPGSTVSTGSREIYKIRMSYNAFKKMSYQRLHEFSLRRSDLPPREPWTKPMSKAVDFFNSVKTSLERDTQLDETDTIASLYYRVADEGGGRATLKQLAPTLLRRLFDENRQVLSTPSSHLNEILAGGLYPGQLYILAGFPGAGTSTLALQMVNQMAAEQNTQCLFVGLQRGVEEVFKRSLSYLGNLTASEIDNKRQNPQELYEDKDFNRRIFAAYERYQQFADNITIIEGAAAGSMSRINQIIIEKREEQRNSGTRGGSFILVVDSLQLLVSIMRANWVERVSEGENMALRELARWDAESLTSKLKAMARELDITVLATHELYTSSRNLTADGATNDPVVQDLYNQTQFADTVMVLTRLGASLLNLRDWIRSSFSGTPLESRIPQIEKRLQKLEDDYRQTQQFQQMRSEFTVLDIVKNRSGPRDKVLFAYHKPTSHFEPVDYHI